MSLAIIILTAVLLITLLGILLVEVVLARRPGWQDFACRLTLTASLVVPLSLLAASIFVPDGLVRLPWLKAAQTSNEQASTSVSDQQRDGLGAVLGAGPSVFEKSIGSTIAPNVGSNSESTAKNGQSGGLSDGGSEFDAPQSSKVTDNQVQPESGSTPLRIADSNGDQPAATAVATIRTGKIFGWLAIVWASGSFLAASCFTFAWIGLRRLTKSANPVVGTRWNRVAEKTTLRMELGQAISIASTPEVSTPMVVGIRAPVILLPDSMFGQIGNQPGDHQIESIIGHEVKHIQRRDTTWSLLSCVAFILWWPVPTIHLLRKRVAWVRELICDANAVGQVGSAEYAEILLEMATLPVQRKSVVTALSMQPAATTLESRIRWVLEYSGSTIGMPKRLLRNSAWCCMAFGLLLFVSVRLVPATLVDTVDSSTSIGQQVEEGAIVAGTVAVRSGESSDPVADATVYMVPVPERGWELPVRFESSKSNEDGAFEFQGVSDGNYMIWAEGNGLTTLKAYLTGKRFKVVGGEEDKVDVGELRLVDGCNYRVSVVSAKDNSPITDAEVSFGWSDTGRSYQTDANGIADIRGLAPNAWYFVIRAEGYATTFNKTAVQAVGTTTEVKFSLEPGATIKGTLTDQHGNSVADAEVYCSTDEMSMAPNFAKVMTDMGGEFEMNGVPFDHKIRISSSPEGYKRASQKTSIEEAASITTIDLLLEKLPYGGDVIVTVLDQDGSPIQGAELFNRGSSSSDVRTAKTDAEGKARLVNMFNYRDETNVVVRSTGKVPTLIKVKPGTAKEPGQEDVTLSDGKTLRGRIVTPDGKPAANVSVFLNEANRGSFVECNDLKWPRIRTDAEGRFEVGELGGDTRITVYTPKQYAPIESYEVKLDGDDTEVLIEMTKAASLRVRAVDSETGEPIPAFNVKIDWVEEGNRLEGDRRPRGVLASLINPGTNIHGTQKEFVLEGQTVNLVYSMIVAADGYETAKVPRIRATVDPDLVDIKLVKSKDE